MVIKQLHRDHKSILNFSVKNPKSPVAIKQYGLLSTLCVCDNLLKIFTILVFILQFCISGLETKIWKKILVIQRTLNWTSTTENLWKSQMQHSQLLYIGCKLHQSALKTLVDMTSQEDPIMFLFQHMTNLQALVFLCYFLPRASGLLPAELFDFSKIWLLLIYLT